MSENAVPLLSVEHVGVTFGKKSSEKKIRALDDITFAVKPGERFGVVGETGSGKSTMAKVIVGLERVTEGRVLFEGEEIRSANKRNRFLPRKIQLVLQDPYGSFDPAQRIRDCLIEPLLVNRVIDSKREAEGMLAEVFTKMGLRSELLERYPHDLSGGQRQRVSIARAMLMRPKLLILDEPTSGLDVSTQAHVVRLLQDLAKAYDQTYIFISHDLELIWHVCDRVCVLYGGRVSEIGVRDEIYGAPHSEYLKELVGHLKQ